MIPIMCGAATLMGFDAQAFQEDSEGCFATEVIDYSPGEGNENVSDDRTNPIAALGEPDRSNAPGGFVSLGHGGSITLKLGGSVINNDGPDIMIWETTFSGDTCKSNSETAMVELSDGITWVEATDVCNDGMIELDGIPLASVNYIRITDLNTSPNDGYDVDGIEAIHGCNDFNPEPGDCNNFDYFLADNPIGEADELGAIYSLSIMGSDGSLTLLTDIDYRAHIAYDTDLNRIYAVHNDGTGFDTIDPFTGVSFGFTPYGMDMGSTPTAVYKDGMLLVGSSNKNKIFSYDLSNGTTSVVANNIPVSGGDLFFNGGDLYLATRTGNKLWKIEAGVPMDAKSIPAKVLGAAITNSGNILLANSDSMALNVFNSDGTDSGNDIALTLNGEPFKLRNGDLASGCNIPNNETPEVCNNFDYFIADKQSGDEIIIYAAENTGTEVNLTMITTRDPQVSIAYDEVENIIYGIDPSGNTVEKIDPVTGASLGVIDVDPGLGGGVFSAVYKDGMLFTSSSEQDRIVAIDLSDGSFTELADDIPIQGGDLVFLDNELFISTKTGDRLLKRMGESFIDVGTVPSEVHGASATADGNIALIAQNSNEVQVVDREANPIGSIPIFLNGEPFTLQNGDFAGGCNLADTEDDEEEECVNFDVFYADIPLGSGPGSIYKVNFTGGSADLDLIREFEGNANYHIAYNTDDNVIYAVNENGSGFETVDPIFGTSTFTAFPQSTQKTTTAVYNDGKLLVGSSRLDEIYEYDLTTGTLNMIANAPVRGGDLVIVDEQLFLASQNAGGNWYSISGGSATQLVATPGNGLVNGAAVLDDGSIMFSNKDENVFRVLDGDDVTDIPVFLDGEPFTLRWGDLATGCNLQNNETPVPAGCYAANVLEYIEGTERNGGEIASIRTETPENVLGEPEGTDEFVFTTLGYGGSITLTFDGAVQNVPGPDLLFVETTFGNTDCDSNPEFADIYVSVTGEVDDYFYAGTVCKMDPTVDISDAGAFDFINFVKVVNNDEMTTTNDGYDLDGVVALGTCVDFDLETFLSEQNETLASNSQDTLDGAFEMWPVPAKNELNVKVSQSNFETLNYQVVSITGQTLNRGSIDAANNQRNIDITNLADGTYFLIMSLNDETVTKQFVKATR